jgi:hypothetical protein
MDAPKEEAVTPITQSKVVTTPCVGRPRETQGSGSGTLPGQPAGSSGQLLFPGRFPRPTPLERG